VIATWENKKKEKRRRKELVRTKRDVKFGSLSLGTSDLIFSIYI